MKKRILLLGAGDSPHLFKWAYELSKNHIVRVVTFSFFSKDFKKYFSEDQLVSLNQKIDVRGNNFRVLFSFAKVAAIVNDFKPDIVNAHYASSYGLVWVLSRLRIKPHPKTIISTWGSDVLVFPFKSLFHRLVLKFVLRSADYITSDSFFMSDVIWQIAGRKANTFPFGLTELPTIHIEKKNPFLFFSNRALEENYCIDLVIQVFADLKKELPTSHLVIANKGSMEDRLKKQVEQLGIEESVSFVGYLSSEEQSNYYQAASFYFSLPKSDATSVSLLEAMGSGCIPLVSNIPANREWILPGVNGLFEEKISKLEINTIYMKQESIIKMNREIIKSRAVFPFELDKFIKDI